MKRKPDEDLKYAFEYNQPQPFKLEEVDDIHAAIAGHNEDDDWYWIVELTDGRFFLVQAGCDYTGWDCRSSCSCLEAKSAEEAAGLAKEEYTKRGIAGQLLKQLRGEQPYGLEIKP